MRKPRPDPASALTFAVAVAAILAACGTSGPTSDPAPIREAILHVRSNAAVDGPGVEVDEAIASAAGEPVLVNGSLFVQPDGSAALCAAMLESFPPQCGGSRLTVRGLDETMVGPLDEAQGLRWAERVQLFGTIELIRDPRQLPGDDAAGGDGTRLGGGDTPSGPGLAVEEAIDTTLDEVLLVQGFLVAAGDEVTLCSALAESFPPQCAGARLSVLELDLTDMEGELTTANGVTWSEQPIRLLGRVSGDVMTVETTATSSGVP